MAKLYWRLKKDGKWTWVAVDPEIARLWQSLTPHYGLEETE